MRSDHKAIIASGSNSQVSVPSEKIKRIFRPRSPSQNADFLNYLRAENHALLQIDSDDVQAEFDRFYKSTMMLLDKFYPEKIVTISTRDPSFVTPGIKVKLKEKNKLMRADRLERANAIALQIGKEICRNNAAKLTKTNKSTNSTQMWKEVTRYTKQSHDLADSSIFNAEMLNDHYAGISTDQNYTRPSTKIDDSLHCQNKNDISEEQVFYYLDKLKVTATGLDKLPSWFLRLGAPFVANPLSKLFNMSLSSSIVPSQWKAALIRPLAKVKTPESCSDFLPISITPVLSRVMEKWSFGILFIPPSSLHLRSYLLQTNLHSDRVDLQQRI